MMAELLIMKYKRKRRMGEESDDDLSNIVITFISIAFLVSAIFTALYTYFLLPVLLTSSPSVSFGPQDDENEQENEEGSEESTKTKRFLWRPRSKFWLKQLSVFVTCTLSILKYLVRYWHDFCLCMCTSWSYCDYIWFLTCVFMMFTFVRCVTHVVLRLVRSILQN